MTDQRITEEARAFLADAAAGAAVEPRMLRIARALVDTDAEVARLRGVVQTVDKATAFAPRSMSLGEMNAYEAKGSLPWVRMLIDVRTALAAAEGLPVPTEPQSMRWLAPPVTPGYVERRPHEIVAWVNANGGEAWYVPVGKLALATGQIPLIAVRQADGTDAYAAPGDTIVMVTPGEFRAVPTDEDTR